MIFSHIADVHIGGYREEKLKQVSIRAFNKAIDISIERGVDFILVSGDLFNTSLPSIDDLKQVTSKFYELKQRAISVYMIAGSHDFSPSGKTMLDVLENAGLCKNVVRGDVVEGKLRLRFTVDEKTGAKITGMLGRKGMLEKTFYESLDTKHLEQEPGFKIFMFHTAITELKTQKLEKMSSSPISLLPKNFQYYAGGHVHYPLSRFDENLGGHITYTGALFPNNFKELEDLGSGGFWLYDTEKQKPEFKRISLYYTHNIRLDCNHKSPEQVYAELFEEIKNKEFYDTIILIRLFGKMKTGRVADIELKKIFDELYDRGAYFVMKNTSSLTTEEFEEISLQSESVEEIEETLIQENTGQMNFERLLWDKNSEKEMTDFLFNALNLEKDEGEKVADFEDRIRQNVKRLTDMENFVQKPDNEPLK